MATGTFLNLAGTPLGGVARTKPELGPLLAQGASSSVKLKRNDSRRQGEEGDVELGNAVSAPFPLSGNGHRQASPKSGRQNQLRNGDEKRAQRCVNTLAYRILYYASSRCIFWVCELVEPVGPRS